MEGLGFGDGYVAQGGDIGSYVTNELGAKYPACKSKFLLDHSRWEIAEEVKVIHVNYSNPPPRPLPSPGSPGQEAPPPSAEDLLELLQKFGYALEHSTRPATVGLVVGSNPLSLLAWVGEKFLEWTDESPSEETILTMTSLYWFTDCFTTSIYTYRYASDPVQTYNWRQGWPSNLQRALVLNAMKVPNNLLTRNVLWATASSPKRSSRYLPSGSRRNPIWFGLRNMNPWVTTAVCEEGSSLLC